MRSIAFAALLALAGAPALAQTAGEGAQSPRAVIELFTSQGCSSCPPADKRLSEMAGDPDLVALTLPVDYWDYLGWKDTLARPAFSNRQRAYAKLRGDRAVYTPQMVVNGEFACIGSDATAVAQSMRQATQEDARLPVALATKREGTRLTVEIGEGAEGAGELWLLTIEPRVSVSIDRGENRGRVAHYANVVRDIAPIGAWRGGPARFAIERAGLSDAYVVLLQRRHDGRPGRILGAAKGPAL
ncbi:MAG: DUF1223 domain-containing protein [Salinarimonadaceae bacterium]|nr:MAG: DUF1223 domain-containing protein [Salinarimonadaceae bacterium]